MSILDAGCSPFASLPLHHTCYKSLFNSTTSRQTPVKRRLVELRANNLLALNRPRYHIIDFDTGCRRDFNHFEGNIEQHRTHDEIRIHGSNHQQEPTPVSNFTEPASHHHGCRCLHVDGAPSSGMVKATTLYVPYKGYQHPPSKSPQTLSPHSTHLFQNYENPPTNEAHTPAHGTNIDGKGEAGSVLRTTKPRHRCQRGHCIYVIFQ